MYATFSPNYLNELAIARKCFPDPVSEVSEAILFKGSNQLIVSKKSVSFSRNSVNNEIA